MCKLSDLQRAWIKQNRFWTSPWGRMKLSKLGTRCFAVALGVPVPELYWVGKGEPLHLPSNYVMKPDRGSGGRNVVLCKNGTRLGTPPPREEITLVEELLDTGSIDLKVWTFDGMPRLIQRINRANGRHRFYDRAWQPVQILNNLPAWRPIDDKASAPPHLEELLFHAEKVGRNFACPFVRVDMYDTPRGAVLGELTLMPKALAFPDIADRYLATFWGPREDARVPRGGETRHSP